MHEDAARQVLLVKALEEEDADGVLLPPADRLAAARDARREVRPGARDESARLLAARAAHVLATLAPRHPLLPRLAARMRWPGVAIAACALAGLIAGFGLSALDGAREIDLIGWALPLLLAWNLLVYAAVAAAALRPAPLGAPLRATLARWAAAALARIPASVADVHAPLARAATRFASQAVALAMPRLVAQAGVALHLAAALLGVGFALGLALRGLGLEYRAGWESTFLGPAQAHAWMQVIYGLGALAGWPVPDVAHVANLEWSRGGGENARFWIGRIAVTVAIVVVLPRLALAALAALRASRARRAVALPFEIEPVFRAAFRDVEGAVRRSVALVAPYAFAPGYDAMARLVAWLDAAEGGGLDIRVADPAPYGEEERHRETLGARAADADLIVVAFALAATPEEENHGRVLAQARDWLARERPAARLTVVVDEGDYARRVAGAAQRVEERRDAWRRFVAAHGLEARFAPGSP